MNFTSTSEIKARVYELIYDPIGSNILEYTTTTTTNTVERLNSKENLH